MKTFSFFHPETGALHPGAVTFTNPNDLAANTPPGLKAIDGVYDHQSQRVDPASGKVVDWQPPQPSAEHEWNGVTRRWQLNAAAQAREDAHRAAMAEILALESKQHRAMREAALGSKAAIDLLADIDKQIAAARSQLKSA